MQITSFSERGEKMKGFIKIIIIAILGALAGKLFAILTISK